MTLEETQEAWEHTKRYGGKWITSARALRGGGIQYKSRWISIMKHGMWSHEVRMWFSEMEDRYGSLMEGILNDPQRHK